MSVEQGPCELADDNESDVFEIVLPVTVFVLSDDDFLQDDTEEQEAWNPVVKQQQEEEKEEDVNMDSSILLKSDVTPQNDSHSVSIQEENRTPSKENNMKCSEEKCVAESTCDHTKASLSDLCDAGMDECSQNNVLPTSSCKTELTEINETRDRKECGGHDSLQKIPPVLSSAANEGGDETKTSRQLASAEIRREEELVTASSVTDDDSQEKQPEIYEEVVMTEEMEDPDSSKNRDTEANDSERTFDAEHCFNEETEFADNCSAALVNGSSPTSEELQQDVGELEVNASTSAESSATGEHIYRTLTPFPRRRYRQQEDVSPHAGPEEFQMQQEGLAWLSNNVAIKPVSKASCSLNKHEGLKCRFCSSVYKRSAHLKKHIYAAHKDKKIHKCCFCKRTFFFAVNLKNHLNFHKKMTKLQKARKSRINARKVRQRRSEEGQSETNRKESKYDKFFIKVERDFTPLDAPVSFSCRSCFFASSSPRIFIHHMKGHKEKPPYQCPQCDYSSISLSYLLNHMYWHAGYKLYQCRFCTFFSLYFASMVRHSHIHTGPKPYSCEFCHSTFRSTTELERHRRLHEDKETCQGQQPDFLSGRKRAQRPLKNYPCDECNVVFYTRGHLSFHKKFHEQFKANANGYKKQSKEYHKSKRCRVDSDSEDDISLSLSGQEKDCLSRGVLASEVGFGQAGDVWDNKKLCSGKKFPGNSHRSNSLPVFGNRSEIPLNSYEVDTGICKEEPVFNSRASRSQDKDDDAYHSFVENLKETWPFNLSMFKRYKCQHCNYATGVHSDFKLHLKVHTDENPFACQESNKTFKTSNHLQKHSQGRVNNGRKFGRCLCEESSLETHELHHEMRVGMHSESNLGSLEDPMLTSEVCGVQPDVQRVKENDLLAQSQQQFYQCAECEYATYILSNLQLHVRTHTGEKPYSCSVCQKKFRTSSHLRRHRVTHFKVEHLKCRNCDYSTNKWLSLKRHLASHSCGESSSSGSPCQQHHQLPFKTYTCDLCGYSTAHNGNLKPHLRIHTGEKPFRCGQCPLAFRTSSHLKRHLVTHLKLRCRRCKFSTADKRAFQQHVKTHTKKYKCGRCNVMLPTRKLLEKHKQLH